MNTYFFQYNLPQDNHRSEKSDHFINVLSQWHGGTFESGRPIVHTKILVETIDLLVVKDFSKAYNEIEKLAENHFAEMAHQQIIDNAKKILGNAKALGTIVVHENGVAEAIN